MKFKKNFIINIIIKYMILYFISYIIMMFIFEKINIRTDAPITVWLIIIPLVYGVIISCFSLLIAKTTVKRLRRRGHSLAPNAEFAFFKKFIIFIIILTMINTIFLYFKIPPYLKNAFYETEREIYMLNSQNTALRDQKLDELYNLHSSYLTIIRVSAISQCIIQIIIYLMSAKHLIKTYQSSYKRG